MSKVNTGSANMIVVAVFCAAMSLLAWLFLVLFQDTLFAPTDGAVHAKTQDYPEKAKPKPRPVIDSVSRNAPIQRVQASSTPSGSDDTVSRLTKDEISTPNGISSESTFSASEENKISANSAERPESATERSTRLMRQTLGISKRPSPTHAMDVSLIGAGECVKQGEKTSEIPVLFSHNAETIRGKSLIELNALLTIHRRCGQGIFKMATNPLGDVDASESLTQMRVDELKYFFRQNGVPLEALKFPSNL
ncbi:MAG: hypothetical protein AB8B84_05355 [Granulosicoccus sp.]